MEEGKEWHVFLRGNNHQDMFYDRRDFIQVINRLAVAAYEKDTDIRAYCFLSNHFHLLIRSKDLSGFMHYFRMSLTHWFNRRYRSVGNVGTRKFGRTLVKSEEDLVEVASYILRNPLWHGLADDPFGYPWSSVHCYFNKENARYKKCPVFSGVLTNPNKIREYLPSNVSLPPGYKMSLAGLILPESYISFRPVEKAYGSFSNFMQHLFTPSCRETRSIKEKDTFVSGAENEKGESKFTGEQNLRTFVEGNIRERHLPEHAESPAPSPARITTRNVRSDTGKQLLPDSDITEFLLDYLNDRYALPLTRLNFDQKMATARLLKQKFPGAAFKQLARILYIPETTLRRHW